jgi:hypothetical protein
MVAVTTVQKTIEDRTGDDSIVQSLPRFVITSDNSTIGTHAGKEPTYTAQTGPYLTQDSASRYKDDRPNGTYAVRFLLDIKQDAEQIRKGQINITGSFTTMIFPTKSAYDNWYTPERKQTHRLDYPGAEQFIGFDPRKFYL